MRPGDLLARLAAIARLVATDPAARAVIALGSAGRERARLDEHSDLDVFVVVDDGRQRRYLESPDWLRAVEPIAFAFANTRDAWKILFADGIFCELAVFGASELATIPFAPGQVVWRRADVPESIAEPALPLPDPAAPDPAWSLGEALSNLLVGLHRWQRGERLAAFRLIQVHAVDRLLELAAGTPDSGGQAAGMLAATATPDAFARERRVERRAPAFAVHLPQFVPGYGASPAAALAILGWLEEQHPVAPALAARIRELAAPTAE